MKTYSHRCIFLAVCVFCCVATQASGVTRYVSTSGTDTPPYTNWSMAAAELYHAVDACSDGDEIVIGNGNYWHTNEVVVTKGITIRGENHQGAWIQNADTGYRCLTLSHTGIVVEGLIIRSFDVTPAHGGAILITEKADIKDCLIRNNRAGDGGGIYIEGTAEGTWITGCQFENNLGTNRAGGVCTLAGTVVDQCLFSQNQTYNNVGGVSGGTGLVVRNSDFVENYGYEGSAMGVSDGAVIENCTITRNRTWNGAPYGALQTTNGVTIRNCIVYDNHDYGGVNIYNEGGSNTVSYTCSVPLPAGPGNTDSDPLMADPNAWNFSLVPGSPCIDAGTNQAWMSGAEDIAGNNRIINARVDIGAHETALTVNFSASPLAGVAPLSVVFTSVVYDAGNTVTNYRWDFDNDGLWDMAGPQRAVVTNSYPLGIYSVLLKAELDTGDSGTHLKNQYVKSGAPDLYVSLSGSHTPPYTNWMTAATNVQAVVPLAAAGTVIHVTNGTYESTEEIRLPGGANLVSENGKDFTVLRQSGPNARCLYLEAPGGMVDGFFITGGTNQSGSGIYMEHGGSVRNCTVFSNAYTWGQGGGVYMQYGGVLDNCEISYNYASSGGGIYLGYGGSLSNCTIKHNSAQYNGGGLYGYYFSNNVDNCSMISNVANQSGGGGLIYGKAWFENCRIDYNKVTASGNSGGIYAYSGGSFSNCTINFNSAYNYGGLNINNGGPVSHCDISGNISSNGSGGAYVSQAGLIEYCTFTNNAAGTYAGGVAISGSTMRNCLVANNTAVNQAGGIYLAGSAFIENCTVVDNHAGWQSGGIDVPNSGRVVNSIVYNNTASNGPNYWNNNNPVNTWSNTCTTPAITGTGSNNVTAPPYFVDPSAGDYRIKASSSARDSGTNMPGIAGTLDLQGSNRIVNGIVDMGAYELQSASFACGFSAGDDFGMIPLTIVFTAQVYEGSAATSYFAWDFDNNGSVDAQGMGLSVVTNIYAMDGLYSVSLTASNGAGESDTVLREDIIHAVPAAYFYRYVSMSGSNTPPYDTWEKAAHSIIDAVNAAPDQGVVWVTNGTYNIGTVTVNRDITIRSVNGRDVTVMAGNGSSQGFTLYGGRLIGLKITGAMHTGVGTSGSDYYNEIIDCHIVSNNGTGINLLGAAGTFTVVSNCLVTHNSYWSDGGGIYISGEALVTDCTISNNRSTHAGAGINCNSGSGIVERCTIVNNTSGRKGAGAYLAAPYVIRNCLFADNTATNTGSSNSAGGGVSVGNGGRVEYSVIRGNHAEYGAAAHVYYDGLLRNCLVYDNAATNYGGGLYVDNGVVESCTIADNTAGIQGGGLYGFGNIVNSVIYHNSAPSTSNHYASASSFTNCCTAPSPPGSANVTLNPSFTDRAGDNYRPDNNSPCLNAGLNQNWMNGVPDIQGAPRVVDDTVDIGAYEFPYPFVRADFTGTPREGVVPLETVFEASLEVYEPSLTLFWWDLNGDAIIDYGGYGKTVATGTYASAGIYSVALTVDTELAPVKTFTRPGYIRAEPLSTITHYVSPSGSHTPPYTNWITAATNLRSAIDVCAAFDRIEVTNGLYVDHNPIVISNYVEVSSVNGAEETVFDHEDYTGRVIILDPYARLTGVTVMRGHATDGGGIYAYAGGEIDSCIVVSNSGNNGGGVYLNENAVIRNSIVERNQVHLNTGSYGGGIYSVGGIVENCTVRGNYSHTGAGIYMTDGAVSACTLYANVAYWQGGDNGSRGGGIYMLDGLVDRCTVGSNAMFGMNRHGGGVYMRGGTLRSSLIRENNQAAVGAGVFANGGGTIENCTVSDCAALSGGDGIHCVSGGVTIVNSIVYDNSAGPDIADDGMGFTMSYSVTRESHGGSSNFTNDPLFVDAANLNFQLSPASPAKDSGTNLDWMIQADDLAGQKRIIGGTVDRGAMETPYSVDFIAWQREGHAPFKAVFTGIVEGAHGDILFQWDFDDNGSIDAQGMGLDVVSNTYAVPGDYSVSLTISNALGDTAAVQKTDYIYSAPPDIYVAKAGANIYPFASWADAATNIQDALYAGIEGCTVWITNDTYALNAELELEDALTVRSLNGRDTVIIDGQDAVRCFYVTDPGAVIRGVTVQNGYIWLRNGGGILASQGCAVVDCVIRENWCGNYGGGISIGPVGVVSNCLVTANETQGSGIGIHAVGALVTDCDILDNKAAGPDGYYGGGIYAVSSTVTRCTVKGNTSYAHGGGIYALAGSLIEFSTVSGNTNQHWMFGGGVSLHGGSMLRDSIVEMNDCGNVAAVGGVNVDDGFIERCEINFNRDGGVRILNSGYVRDCTLIGNRKAGVTLYQGSVRNSFITGSDRGVDILGSGSLESCTIANNEGTLFVGLYVEYQATGTVRNCIIYNNEGNGVRDNHGILGVLDMTYSCTWPPIPGEGNISAYPEFADYYNDQRLLPGSPCIDAGVNEGWMTTATDGDGHSRILFGAVDMGVYEVDEGGLAANFVADEANGPGPRDVVFTGYVGGTNSSGLYYAWDFDGDGTNDLAGLGLSVVTQHYAGFGWHDVSLTVSNAVGEVVTREKSDYIGLGPELVYVAHAGAHIPPYTNWVTAATNLQDAIDVGLRGTRVLITNGTYVVNSPVTVENGVSVEAFNGLGTVVIDGNDTVRCLELNGEETRIVNLVVRNGNADTQNGGAVKLNGSGSIVGCDIADSGGQYGGGVDCYFGGVITNSTIRGCQSSYDGGGIYMYGGGLVANCVVASNESLLAGGGGIYGSVLSVVRDTRLQENSCDQGGGGLTIENSASADHCIIVSNRCGSGYQGAGAYLAHGARLQRSTIAYNRADSGAGGGLYMNYGGVLENSLVHHNNSGGGGGGLYANQGAVVRNCTVTDNTSTNPGGGAYVASGALSLVNSICYSNAAGGSHDNFYVNAGSLEAVYSCLYPNPGGTGNTDAEPQLADPAAYNYHLTEASPCVDTASATNAPADDIDGTPRPLDGDNTPPALPDMGAYEYVSAAADTDGDGISDADEVNLYGCSPVVTDSDGDGQDDGDEVIAGVDPTDEGAYFQVGTTATPPSGTGLVISWLGHTGRLYTVRSTEHLLGTWTNLPGCTDVPGIEGSMSCTNDAPGADDFYYSIGVRLDN